MLVVPLLMNLAEQLFLYPMITFAHPMLTNATGIALSPSPFPISVVKVLLPLQIMVPLMFSHQPSPVRLKVPLLLVLPTQTHNFRIGWQMEVEPLSPLVV